MKINVRSFKWSLQVKNVNSLKLFNFHNSTTAYLRWPWSNNGEIHLTFVFNLKVWQKSRFHVRTLACIQTQAVVFSLPQDIWPMMISTPLNDVNITIYHPFRYSYRQGYCLAYILFRCFCRSGDLGVWLSQPVLVVSGFSELPRIYIR